MAVAAAREVISRRRLRELRARRDGPALVHLAGHLGALLATAGVIHQSLGSPWLVPALALHGIVVVFLFAPFHEATHGTAFRTAWLNDCVGWLCGLVLLRPPLYFRYRHAAHHTYTQDPARDPDRVPIPATFGGYAYHLSGLPFWGKVFGILLRVARGRLVTWERAFISDSEHERIVGEARIFCAVYALAAAVAVVTGSCAPVLYWLVPRILGEPVLRMVRMAEHTGCDEVPDFLLNTRTMLTTPLVRALYWNMPYHAEHHFAPSVPFHALPALHREIQAHVKHLVPGYVGVHRGLVANLRRGREPGAR